MLRIALTRPVPSSINQCELTHVARTPIDIDAARDQHAQYERALDALGCRVDRVPLADDMPDSVFIEDTAVVVDEIAVITRPGAESRRAETAAVANALRKYRPLRFIEAPATIDGGDVLVIGKRVFVGMSQRTNSDGANQLRNHLAPFGYAVEAMPVQGALHLKSAVTQIADGTVLINEQWIRGFDEYARVDVDPSEPFAANALRIADALIYPTMFPRTRATLKNVHAVDASELAKAEGGVTCCSIVFTVA